MGKSTIKNRTIKFVTYTVQITWASTSNPYFDKNYDVSLPGYKAISAGYQLIGTNASLVHACSFTLTASDLVMMAFRASSAPSSTTQNKVNLFVLYAPI